MLLLFPAGHSQAHLAQDVCVQRTVVCQWAKRFLAQCVDRLPDAPGRGAKGGFSQRWRSTSCAWPASAPMS
jgi:hypothetical protein